MNIVLRSDDPNKPAIEELMAQNKRLLEEVDRLNKQHQAILELVSEKGSVTQADLARLAVQRRIDGLK